MMLIINVLLIESTKGEAINSFKKSEKSGRL